MLFDILDQTEFEEDRTVGVHVNNMSSFQKEADIINKKIEFVLYKLIIIYETLLSNSKSIDLLFDNALEVSKQILEVSNKVEQISSYSKDSIFINCFIDFISTTGFSTVHFREVIKEIRSRMSRPTCHIGYDLSGTKLPLSQKSLIIIARFTRKVLGEIIYSSHHAQEVLKRPASQVTGVLLVKIMPACYAEIHDSFITDFFINSTKKIKQFDVPIYPVDPDGFMIMVNTIFKIYPYFTNDLRVVV